MSKIVAVHVGERQKPFSLIQQVDEAGFLDKVKQAVGLGKKEEPAKQQQADDEPAQRATPSVHDSSALATIASEILDVPAGESRVVLFMSHGQLKSYYLVSGGGQKLIDALDDKTIAKMVGKPQLAESSYKVGDLIKEIAGGQRPEVKPSEKMAQRGQAAQQATPAAKSKVELVMLGSDFGYDQVVTPPGGVGTLDRAVLINAPADLVKQIKDASSIEEAKVALKKLMSHKIYVMTLNLTNATAGNLVPEMSMAQTTDEKAKLLNPNIIENYPMNTRWAAAKKEWQSGVEATPKEMTDDERREAEVAKKEKEAEWAERERNADTKKSGPTTDENSEIVNIIVKAGDSFKAANSLQGIATTRKISKSELLARLDSLQKRFPLVNIPGVIERLQKMKFD